jgi:hypothetical protein
MTIEVEEMPRTSKKRKVEGEHPDAHDEQALLVTSNQVAEATPAAPKLPEELPALIPSLATPQPPTAAKVPKEITLTVAAEDVEEDDDDQVQDSQPVE